MTTPQSYIEECVKKFDETFPVPQKEATHYDDICKCFSCCATQESVKLHLTSSLNGLLELFEKEIEGRKIEFRNGMTEGEAEIAQALNKEFDKEAYDENRGYNSALSDLSTWLKSIK